jgi:hypothetical protein
MSRILYSESEQFILAENPNVLKVSDRAISYQADFKIRAVRQNLAGKTPVQIFTENGFNLDIIGHDKPGQCLARWRVIYKQYGETGLCDDKRGSAATGRPVTSGMTAEQKLQRAEARIRFLEAELDFLKKLEEMERRR